MTLLVNQTPSKA